MDHQKRGFTSTITVKEAKKRLFEHIKQITQIEKIGIFHVCNRKLSEDIFAPRPLPGFTRSAMDGFAVQAEDTFGASDTNPRQIKIIGEIEIGVTEVENLENKSAMRISTGAPVPNGATAVVKIEDCEILGNDILEIYSPVSVGKNIAQDDEDVKQGELILKVGHVIRPWDVSLLLGLGISHLLVYSAPRIAILSTGDELISVEQTPKVGQVVDSNRPTLEMWIKEFGGNIIYSKTCSDNKQTIINNIKEINTCDLIITTGGTSMGTRDYMLEITKELGEIWVQGVSIRPGKPVLIGKIDDTPIIALPGYPLAAFLNFNFFCAPLLTFWTGLTSYLQNEIEVELAENIASRNGVRDIARLREIDGKAHLIRITGAGILSSLSRADYLLEIPEDLEGYVKGEIVKVKEVKN